VGTAEAGVHAEIAEFAEIDTADVIVCSPQRVAQYMRTSAMAATRRLDELPPRSEDQDAHGHMHAVWRGACVPQLWAARLGGPSAHAARCAAYGCPGSGAGREGEW